MHGSTAVDTLNLCILSWAVSRMGGLWVVVLLANWGIFLMFLSPLCLCSLTFFFFLFSLQKSDSKQVQRKCWLVHTRVLTESCKIRIHLIRTLAHSKTLRIRKIRKLIGSHEFNILIVCILNGFHGYENWSGLKNSKIQLFENSICSYVSKIERFSKILKIRPFENSLDRK